MSHHDIIMLSVCHVFRLSLIFSMCTFSVVMTSHALICHLISHSAGCWVSIEEEDFLQISK